jgi:hypothetical protein
MLGALATLNVCLVRIVTALALASEWCISSVALLGVLGRHTGTNGRHDLKTNLMNPCSKTRKPALINL